MIPDPDLIAFFGDWHGDGNYAESAIRALAENDVHVFLHVGDFGFTFNRPFMRHLRHALDDTGSHLYFVRGNHDDDVQLDHRWGVDADGFGTPPFPGRGSDRIHYIPQGHRWKWWGKTFMGLGGAHSVDRQWRTPLVDWWPGEWITTGDMYRAMKGGKVDVMITHDLPANAQLPNERKSWGWPKKELEAAEQHRQLLQSVVDEVQPELLVHGHFHHRYEQQVGGLHVVGLDMNGSPFAENTYIIGPDMIEREYRDLSWLNYPDEVQQLPKE